MAEFFDASQFDQFNNEDELFAYIVEEIVKPRLREALGEDQPIDEIQGKVLVFGGRDGVDPDEIERVQEFLQEGLELSYILEEMTDLEIRSQRETTMGGLTISYVELRPQPDTVRPLSADDLEAMFRASPDA